MMEIEPVNVETLTRDITWEILGAFNLPRNDFWQDKLGPFFKKPARRFSEIFAQFDQDVYDLGLSDASKRLLSHFADSSKAVGVSSIPKEGPLLIASNHPGTVDAVSIIANAERDDVKVIVGGMPFLQHLPVASYHTLASHSTNDAIRANVVRQSISHLEDGGAILIFPSGQIDPDPAILPGAVEALEKWSKSIAIMLRRVPETRFVSAITSGVLHEKFARTPLTFLKRDGVGKRRIMEFIQVIRQLLFDEQLGLRPLVTFDTPTTINDLVYEDRKDANQLLQCMIGRAKKLYQDHLLILQDYLKIDLSRHV